MQIVKEENIMQYIIMITVVLGLAIADFVTGIIKAYITRKLSSSKMRKGGLNKIAEIIIMTATCWLEIGIKALGRYYGDKPEKLTQIAGTIAAIAVFGYIALMEMLSMLENYCVINPNALWAKRIVKRLKNIEGEEKKDEKRN